MNYPGIWQAGNFRLKPDVKTFFEKDMHPKTNTKTAYMLEDERRLRIQVNALDYNDFEPEDWDYVTEEYNSLEH